jgi:hypothetical protein
MGIKIPSMGLLLAIKYSFRISDCVAFVSILSASDFRILPCYRFEKKDAKRDVNFPGGKHGSKESSDIDVDQQG